MQTIVFDFDGVIHSYDKGWNGGSIYGKIDMELMAYMQYLMNKGYSVAISSVRSAAQIVSHLSEVCPSMRFALTTGPFWNAIDIVGVSNAKIVGILYVDDRGFRYTNNLIELKDFIGGLK